jgi:acetyl esterase/lipase
MAVAEWTANLVQRVALKIFVLITTVIVRLVRWQMDSFWSWYQEKKWLPNAANYAQDGISVMEGVKEIRTQVYGAMKKEFCHVLVPTNPVVDRVLVYIHGGGFVVANSTVLLHSVTLFCRHGFTVYSMDYPHAPENRFPGPLVSILRALHWMKSVQNIQAVTLFGDSAGKQGLLEALHFSECPLRFYKRFLACYSCSFQVLIWRRWLPP